MPPSKRGSAAKKHVLNLAQLASYDDILTDALVDHVYYWTTIPKNRPSYLPSRGVKEEEITKIIQTHLILEQDLQIAEEKLLATNGLGKFYRALKTEPEKEDFRRHMRRYMQIYLTDCPFEVTTTNRYTISQEEASISARRFIKSHETIKYLSGIQVVITPEEEAQLSARKKDFSIVVSSRKKEVNLFMGPARFANHDCDANARLVTTGQAGIEIIATKPIYLGEEITVTYGDSYFGDDNCECLCKTCEDRLVNGWAPAEGTVPVKKSVEGGGSTPVRGYSLRRRDENAASRSHSETPSLTPIARPKVRKTRLRYSAVEATPFSEEKSGSGEGADSGNRLRRKREADGLATPPVTPAKRQKMMAATETEGGSSTSLSASSRESSVLGSIAVATSDPSGAVTDDNDVDLVLYSPKPKPILRSIRVLEGDEEDAAEKAQDQVLTPEASQQMCDSDSESCDRPTELEKVSSPAMPLPDIVAALPSPESAAENETSEHEDALDIDSNLLTPRRDRRSGGDETDVAEEDDEKPRATRSRIPGDYTLTPLLLSEPETAWVYCTVCAKAFVQHDAYYTRTACPRCERHSKLHGYVWPKTEPEGKGDKEERILDHRLIHRFLDPEDEAKIRGRKPVSWRSESTAGAERPRAKASGSGLGSGIWRKLKYTTAREESEARPGKAAKATKSATTARTAKAAKVAEKGRAGTEGRARRARS